MDAKELSAYANLSLQTIYNLVHTNQIPYSRISKKRAVFDKNEIDEWLKTRKRKIRQPKPISSEEPISEILSKDDSGAGGATLPGTPPSRTSPPPPLPPSTLQLSSRPFVAQLIAVFLFIAIGWGGGFLYFHYKAASNASQNAAKAAAEPGPASGLIKLSPGVIDLAPFMEQGKPGRIDIRIPSVESQKTQVHMDRVSDINVQGEEASLIKPLLIQTLKSADGDYAFKSKTIDIVRPYAYDPKIQEALIYLTKNEKDPAIRMKAVTVLAKVADMDEVKEALLDRLLNDKIKGIRFKALEIIEKNMDRRAISVLEKVKDKETDESIRNRAKAIFNNYKRNNI